MFDIVLYIIDYTDPLGRLVRIEIRGGTQWETQFPERRRVSGRGYLQYPEVEHHREPIRAASLRIDLQADENEDFLVLWTEQEKTFGVNFDVDGKRWFKGYIKPDGIFQDWSRTEYNLSIDAICGLGFLEDLAYVDSNGFNFTGLRKPIKIISDCLLRFDNTRRIRTLLNVEYQGQTAFTDALDETWLKVDRYVQEDNGATITSCKEVLEDVLKTFGVCIAQDEGGWYIYDPEQLAKGEKNAYYEYDENGNRTGELFYSAFQFDTIGSHIDGFELHHINENQRLEMRPSISGVRVYYKYGTDESLLENENLVHNNLTYDGWTINNGTLHDFGANNKDALIYYSASASLVMTANGIAVGEDDLLTLEIQAKNITNPFTPNLEDQRIFRWRARIGNNNYVRVQGIIGVWQSQAVTNTALLEPDSSFSLSIPLDPVPTSGSLIIEVYSCDAVSTNSGFVDFTRFAVQPREEEGFGQPEGENHTLQIPGGTITDDVIEVQNGDNPTSRYYGTIYQTDQITPTSKWSRYTLSEQKAILRLYAEKVVRMNQKPSRYFTGDVYGLLGYLRVMYINNIPGEFLPLGYSYDSYTGVATIVVREIHDEGLVNPLYEFRLDYGNTVKPTIVG